ncbi:Extracellular metalloproteinase 1 [Fusarium oxysporum f. sp. rapae]|uniref:Extracellular metalloproteinase n=1 Tax=Fusarium oxysporum f. sp. rapae TaxID=485398 RepID=A0A8J5NR41_FUSOX|nr:Extracellular metalloproteinase 1 [Fusarium oxysporum f. sp. rapae]
MVQARDAIIDADTALTKGANKCELWKGFAVRTVFVQVVGTTSGVILSDGVVTASGGVVVTTITKPGKLRGHEVPGVLNQGSNPRHSTTHL